MKLRGFLCLAVSCFMAGVQAQDLNIHVDKKGRVGFADKDGNVVIECKYESAMPFSDGVAIVSKSGKFGIIDATGLEMLPLKYTRISPWNDLLYLIADGKRLGLADRTGRVVLKAEYSLISKANCYGKALIARGGSAANNEKKTYMSGAKYGIIDTKGNVLVAPEYKGLYEFAFEGKDVYPYYEGKRLVYSYHYTTDTLVTDCSYLGFSGNGFNIADAGILDGNGKVLLKQGLYSYVMLPQSGMVRYYEAKKKETLCGYHNLETGEGFLAAKFDQAIGDIKFWSHGDFIGGIAPVNGASWSFIDKSGKVLRGGYGLLKHSASTGLWAAQNASKKWDVFDDGNADVAALSGFDNINFPVQEGDREIFSVQKGTVWGCITRGGEVVVPFEYEQVLGNKFDVVGVKKNGKWGMVTADNGMLIPAEYMDILLPAERGTQHYWVKKSDGLYYHLNLTNNHLSEKGYKVATNFVKGIALVVPEGFTLADTQVNRAQIYAPNASRKLIDEADVSKWVGSFGYLLGTDDVLLLDEPVSTMYRDKVAEAIIEKGYRTLTAGEKKSILLEVTRENRCYDLRSVLSEDEWNY